MSTQIIMPGIRQITRESQNNGRKNKFSTIAPSVLPVPGQKDACYKSALLLVEWIDANLDTQRVHFWQGSKLLTTLDEVVNALLSRQLEIEWRFDLVGSFEEVEAQTRELRYQFPIAQEWEAATGEDWRRVLRTGRVRY